MLATRPVYSSWYTFTQQISADLIESEAEPAIGLGCGMIFIDDDLLQLAPTGAATRGWETGVPTRSSFPDLAATDEHVQVEATWGMYQRMIATYSEREPSQRREADDPP